MKKLLLTLALVSLTSYIVCSEYIPCIPKASNTNAVTKSTCFHVTIYGKQYQIYGNKQNYETFVLLFPKSKIEETSKESKNTPKKSEEDK